MENKSRTRFIDLAAAGILIAGALFVVWGMVRGLVIIAPEVPFWAVSIVIGVVLMVIGCIIVANMKFPPEG